MKMERFQCQVVIVLFTFGLIAAEDKLTWSLSSASRSDGSSVVNVTSASILIQPNSYQARTSRESKFAYPKYAFKPRAIPLMREENDYRQDSQSEYKPEMLLPGNYQTIAKVKSEENSTQSSYNPRAQKFHPKAIPLMRGQEFEKRSLGGYEEPIIEKPAGFSEDIASRRSISDYLGVEEGEDYENEAEEEEDELYDDNGGKGHGIGTKGKRKGLKKGGKKLTKYMLPLLLAYKLKFFALVPLLIGGLVLLVGATGMAGFFFALFAAVMGLQKGGY